MTNAAETADRRIALRNGTGAGRRRHPIACAWNENASDIDPLMQGEGHDGIDAMADFGVVAAGGRLEHVTGFPDQVPA
ncbi:MAG TPA: hypothetical protein VF406_05990 [Thermodesulfobacteriota bacterium]